MDHPKVEDSYKSAAYLSGEMLPVSLIFTRLQIMRMSPDQPKLECKWSNNRMGSISDDGVNAFYDWNSIFEVGDSPEDVHYKTAHRFLREQPLRNCVSYVPDLTSESHIVVPTYVEPNSVWDCAFVVLPRQTFNSKA